MCQLQIVVPSTEYFEGKASQVLSLGGGSAAGQVSEAVLLQYCSKIPAVSSFLSYWHGCLCHASIPAGALWEDPDFPAAPSSLYRDPHKSAPHSCALQHRSAVCVCVFLCV